VASSRQVVHFRENLGHVWQRSFSRISAGDPRPWIQTDILLLHRGGQGAWGGTAMFPPHRSAGEGWPHPHRSKATFALQRKEMDPVVVLKSGGQNDHS